MARRSKSSAASGSPAPSRAYASPQARRANASRPCSTVPATGVILAAPAGGDERRGSPQHPSGSGGSSLPTMSRIFSASVASVYPHYLAKVEKKGRTKDELDRVICWLTGFDESELQRHLDQETTFEEFFAAARLNP